MALTAANQTKIKADIALIDTQLAAANATYTALLGDGIASYRFDSGEGSQQTKKRKLSELQETIEYLDTKRESLIEKLNCSSLVNINLSRRGGHGHGSFR